MRLAVALALVVSGTAVADRLADPAPMPRQPPPPPPPPQPPAEIATVGAPLVGAWTCKGVQLPGDGSSRPASLKLAIDLDDDHAWIRTTAVETVTGQPGLKYTEYRTYDAISRAWTRLELASTTAHVVSTSTGEADGKWTWAGTLHQPTGDLEIRDFEKRADAKHLEMWGEELLGGAWQKVYQFSCAKG
jgi:hypothetical protein